MKFSNSQIVKLLDGVFNQPIQAPIIKGCNLGAISEGCNLGVIPDLVWKIPQQTLQNNFFVTYVDQVWYTDSERYRDTKADCKGHCIKGEDVNAKSLFEDTKQFKPILHKIAQQASQECSFNFEIANGQKIVINAAILNGFDLSQSMVPLDKFTCSELKNNTSVLLVDDCTKINNSLLEKPDKSQTILSSDTSDKEKKPFDLNIIKEGDKVSVVIENNIENNQCNEGYCFGNVCIEPCKGDGAPYVFQNSVAHAETNCHPICIEVASNPTVDKPFQICNFTPFIPTIVPKDAFTPTVKIHLPSGSDIAAEIDISFTADTEVVYQEGKSRKINFKSLTESTAAEELIIMTPENNRQEGYLSKYLIMPCTPGEQDYAYIFIIEGEGESQLEYPLDFMECPADGMLNIYVGDNIENNNCCYHNTYLLLKDFMINTECDKGICNPENDVTQSTYIPGFISINHGPDRHGIYYRPEPKDLSLDNLRKNKLLGDKVIVKDMQNICNDNFDLTLVHAQSCKDSIIFSKNIYDVDTGEKIDTKPIKLSENTLHLLTKEINNEERTITANLTKQFELTNHQDIDQVIFSLQSIPLTDLLGSHDDNTETCGKCFL